MSGAARLGDTISCGDVIDQGSGNVFINGLPATRQDSDLTAGHCFAPVTIINGSLNVKINGKPATMIGNIINESLHYCGDSHHPGSISTGSPNVFIN